MRSRRLYFPQLLKAQSYQLTHQEPQFHYLANVLRVKVGQQFNLFNGQGLIASAILVQASKKLLQLDITDVEHLTPGSLGLHLMLSVSKGDRMDYALQKSTELGVTAVTPLWSERGEVKLNQDRLDKKMGHWQGVITSACEQSYQNFCPQLHAPVTLADLKIEPLVHEQHLMCDLIGTTFKTMAYGLEPKMVIVYVGPEGGWSDEEKHNFQSSGVQAVRLGPRVLRTETAPVVMLTLCQYFWGDFC